jgi:hypothetical protein
MVPFGFSDLRRTQPAHVQGLCKKAADGIRTHDLLHGNYARLGDLQAVNMAACSGFVAARQATAISDTRGYAPICSDLGTSAQKCPKRGGRFHCRRGGPGLSRRPTISRSVDYGAVSPTRPYRSFRRTTSSSCSVGDLYDHGSLPHGLYTSRGRSPSMQPDPFTSSFSRSRRPLLPRCVSPSEDR